MQTVVVSRWYPSAEEPLAGVFVQDQVRALRESGDVQVLVPRDAPPGDVLRFLRARGPLDPEQVVPTPRMQLGLPMRWLALERALARRPWRGDVVVHAHLLVPDALPAMAAAHRRGWPFVVTENATFLRELLSSRRARLQARLVLRHADAVIPASDLLAELFEELEPGARMRKIGNPLDMARFRPALSPSRSFALNAVIRVGRAKGTDVLLHAWAEARKTAEMPELVIVGGGPERPRMEELARELGLAGACRFVGRVERDRIVELLRDAAFLVSASNADNTAGIVTEAIACGTPVVSTTVGEPANYVTEEVGLLVPPCDVPALARAVATMAASFDRYDPKRLHAHMDGIYGAGTVRAQLVALYREVLDRRRASSRMRKLPLS